MATEGSRRPLAILLVEDNPADARWVREALGEGQIPNITKVVQDGESALQYLRGNGPFAAAERPDVVLLDLNLPKKSGVEVLADIKSDPSLRDIPVIVLTTSISERLKLIQTYNLPSNTYLLKPLSSTAFIEAIRCYRGLDSLVARHWTQAS